MIFDVEQAKALQRLYQRQLDKQPAKMPEPERKAAAAKAMDRLVGPEWKEAVTRPEGGERVPKEALDAEEACDAEPSESDDGFVFKVKMAMSGEGDHPDGVSYGQAPESDTGKARKQLSDLMIRIKQLWESLGGE